MNKREITRLEAIQRLKDKRLTQKEAAQILGKSTRQAKRLFCAYKAQGAKGLVANAGVGSRPMGMDNSI
jgi:hypothetical protein